ncbi:phosphatidate cytidylyltransferase [Candidatus Pelagibacter sp.]|jgi:phosphatidate cytidylyltransferase|uniref:phosphatidate cytidylyltransferase n=1 Tax=uncultured Candidatus Pelagibacter sp. TaxID=372654 RepID=UPI0023347AEB|nr:phosphatidate cytidylyltransferase [uncultured Candidatus Pelagibacter sp.]MDB4811598.1 phosphatidate cytidylyltransferase [Candidatus Pelagibacter sp.]|tara:strand:- start:572 stop:1261 length:690 start_codon:yes stop_codon:yes gene_type:complete
MSQNLLKRIITSIVLLFLLFFINFSHKYIFIFSILLLGILIYIEANNIFSKLISLQLLKKKTLSETFNFRFLSLNIITFCYVFFVFCNLSFEIHRSEGPIFFLYIISICFFTDIGGYVFGKLIGGKKLSKISPNKTISGTVGSFIFSIIPLILFLNFGYLNLEFNLTNILFSLLISLISQLGDLFVSFFKRKAKIKDTGKLLPGHGGVLDRVDGVLFAIPFSYFLLKLF